MRPVMVENMTVAPIRGISAMPDSLADRCKTTSKYRGTKIVIPTSVPMLQAPASVAQRTTGLARTESGRNGSRTATSLQENTPQSAAEPNSSPQICGEIHSKRRPPQVKASRSAMDAAIISNAPTTSSLCLRGWYGTRRSTFEVIPSAHNPSGKLIQKISDQSTCSVRNPPSTGPPTEDVANTAPI